MLKKYAMVLSLMLWKYLKLIGLQGQLNSSLKSFFWDSSFETSTNLFVFSISETWYVSTLIWMCRFGVMSVRRHDGKRHLGA